MQYYLKNIKNIISVKPSVNDRVFPNIVIRFYKDQTKKEEKTYIEIFKFNDKKARDIALTSIYHAICIGMNEIFLEIYSEQ